MAILAIFYGKGIDKTMYDALRKEVNWEKQLATGGVFHAAGFDDHGDVHISDVWRSAEEMNEFVGSRLAPALQKLKIPMPEAKIFPTHNINMHPNADQYRLG